MILYSYELHAECCYSAIAQHLYTQAFQPGHDVLQILVALVIASAVIDWSLEVSQRPEYLS